MRVIFTPDNVKKLEPSEGRTKEIVWDAAPSSPPAFGVRITPGSRSYVVQYRTRGKSRTYRIARVGAITLAGARDAARAVLRDVAAGGDPVAERRADEEADQVVDLVKDYIATGTTRRGRPRAAQTQGDYDRMLRADVEGSRLGKKALEDVKPWDVEKFLRRKAATAPVRADRLHALLRASFRWGLRKGRLALDPTAQLDRVIPTRTRTRMLTDEEIRRVWKAELDAPASVAVKLLLLLATRRGETLRMRWQDIDVKSRVWTIPGEHRKGRRALAVPLAPQALELIENLRPSPKKSPYVFARERGAIGMLANPDRLARDVREKSWIGDLKLHDLRRTAATGIAKLGAGSELVSRILGHAAPKSNLDVTSEHYDVYDRLAERRTLLEAWARYVVALVADEEEKEDNVIPMVRS